MIGITVKLIDDSKAVADAAQKAILKRLGHIGGSVRKTAVASIKTEGDQGSVRTGREPKKYTKKTGKIRKKWLKWNARKHVTSKPGTPPLSHTRRLPRSIRYAVDKENDNVFIGPVNSVMGEGAFPHEHGGEYKGGTYPARPFMGPAMKANQERFADDFKGSIGE